MKPALILQHLSSDGPAYLATWLAARGVPFEVRNTDAGEAFPERIDGYGALAILGGEMSANDPLPSLRRTEALFLQAHDRGLPTLGHCLGGQLMARALGAAVTASPAPEIGWQPMQTHGDEAACDWFGEPGEHVVFHWHYESFGLPDGARWLARSQACPHQAFAIGLHLAMQFHVEVDATKLARWNADLGEHWDRALADHPASVQTPAQMRASTQVHLAAQQRLADRVYGRWIGLAGAK